MMTHDPQLHFPAASLQTILVTSLEMRGNGKDDPFRRITQFWELDGKLLAEVDPCDPERWMKLQEKLAGLELSDVKLTSELTELKRLLEQRDQAINEMSLEKNERNARIDALENEKRGLTQMCETRDSLITELRTEARESEDRARRLEEALRWALGEHADGFASFEEWANRENKPLTKKAPYYWRTELRERAGLAVATSTSLPAADLAPVPAP